MKRSCRFGETKQEWDRLKSCATLSKLSIRGDSAKRISTGFLRSQPGGRKLVMDKITDSNVLNELGWTRAEFESLKRKHRDKLLETYAPFLTYCEQLQREGDLEGLMFCLREVMASIAVIGRGSGLMFLPEREKATLQ
jgi:hypothetical protein